MWLNTINSYFISNNLLENLPQILAIILIILILSYFIILCAVRHGQKYIIFKPYREVQGSPADLNLPYENVWITAPEMGETTDKIHGWWLPQNTENSPIILYFHGNRGNLAVAPSFRNLRRAAELYGLGFTVLMIDYRGYGNSSGLFPTEAQVYQDAEWAWQYLIKIKNLNPRKIWVYGHSLGGAIAGHLCKEHPEIAGFIADGCFTSITDMARHSWLKIFPANLLITEKFDLINHIKLLQMPILFIHGTNDRTVPSYMSEQLFAVAAAPKELFLVAGAGHNNLSDIAGEAYLKTLVKFITRDYSRQSIEPNQVIN